MSKLFDKKGVMSVPKVLMVLATVIIIMGIAGVANIYMGETVQDVRDDYITNTAGCNSTTQASCGNVYNIGNDSLNAQLALSEKNDSIANVTVAGIIIAVLIAAFGGLFIGRKMGMF